MSRKIYELLDDRRISRGQILLVALLAAALLLDGVDVKLLSYAAPIILHTWGVSKLEFGPALSAAFVGMAIGAAAGGWMGDRVGPRRTAVFSVLLFAIATIACGHADGLISLALLRFVSGIGFGAITPNAYVLVAEWLPRRAQPRAIGILSVASPAGGMIGAGISLVLLPRLGWEWCFVLVGVATLALGTALLWLPEAWSYLARAGRGASIGRAWQRLFTSSDAPPELLQAIPPASGRPRAGSGIFAAGLVRLSAGSFICFFAAQFINYGFGSWMPVALTGAGLSLENAIRCGLFYNAMAIVGGLLSGWLTVRFGSRNVLILSAVTMFLSIGVLAWLLGGGGIPVYGLAVWPLMLASSAAGCSAGSILATISAVVTAGYPAERRATGVGFGVMAGRAGGIVTTLAGGALLSLQGNSPLPLLATLAAFGVLVISAALIVDRHIPGLHARSA